MGLVWMCTEHTWDLNGYTEYMWDLYECAPRVRGTGVDVHRVHVGLVLMCTKRGASTDVHLVVHVGLRYTQNARGTGMDS
jgi:hypothetical protein